MTGRLRPIPHRGMLRASNRRNARRQMDGTVARVRADLADQGVHRMGCRRTLMHDMRVIFIRILAG